MPRTANRMKGRTRTAASAHKGGTRKTTRGKAKIGGGRRKK